MQAFHCFVQQNKRYNIGHDEDWKAPHLTAFHAGNPGHGDPDGLSVPRRSHDAGLDQKCVVESYPHRVAGDEPDPPQITGGQRR